MFRANTCKPFPTPLIFAQYRQLDFAGVLLALPVPVAHFHPIQNVNVRNPQMPPVPPRRQAQPDLRLLERRSVGLPIRWPPGWEHDDQFATDL